MATIRTGKSSKLTLKVETGSTGSGSASYAQRSVSSVNPALSDDDALSIGTNLASLQVYPLSSVIRQDTATLASEG